MSKDANAIVDVRFCIVLVFFLVHVLFLKIRAILFRYYRTAYPCTTFRIFFQYDFWLGCVLQTKKEGKEKDKNKQEEKDLNVTGVVTDALPNTLFRVKLDSTNEEILAYLSGKMRMYRIRVMPGDKVKVEITPYDESRGRIIFRHK